MQLGRCGTPRWRPIEDDEDAAVPALQAVDVDGGIAPELRNRVAGVAHAPPSFVQLQLPFVGSLSLGFEAPAPTPWAGIASIGIADDRDKPVRARRPKSRAAHQRQFGRQGPV